jgi:hypothetical protein
MRERHWPSFRGTLNEAPRHLVRVDSPLTHHVAR